MSHYSKEKQADYIEKMKAKGYCRVNKWCPEKYRKDVNAIIDILSCHHEDPESTGDFHEFINDIVLKVQDNVARFESEYEVQEYDK